MEYDVIVIGGGPAGLVASKIAAGFGKKTALIEKHLLGGDCTHMGCIPSKALLHSAKLFHESKHLQKYGLSGEVKLDASKLFEHVRSVVAEVYATETPEKFSDANLEVIIGAAKFLSKNSIEVNGQVLRAKKFLLATGARSATPTLEGLEDVAYLSNENVFELNEIPKSLTVIGTGAIGIELASAFNKLGTQVNVVLRQESILKKDEPELTEILMDILEGEGIRFFKSFSPKKVAKTSKGIVLTSQKDEQICAEKLLVATGRTPVTQGLDLEKAGIVYDVKGVKVNQYLQTSNPNIFAAGDIIGGFMFTHISEFEARTAMSNALLPFKKAINYEHIGWATFTDPELAHIGLTEEEAKKQGEIRVFKHYFKDSDRGYTDRAKEGLAKFICDKKGYLLGAHILGHRAGDIINEAQVIKEQKIPFYKIATSIHIYPTYNDIIRQCAKKAYINHITNHPVIKLVKSIQGLFKKEKK